jgi:hypothetical protein
LAATNRKAARGAAICSHCITGDEIRALAAAARCAVDADS